MYFIEMFLEQWIMIILELKLLEKIMNQKMKYQKMCLAAFMGSFSGCLLIVFLENYRLLKLFFLPAVVMVTVKIAYKIPIQKTGKYSAYLLVFSIFTGGIWTMIKNQVKIPWIIAAVFMFFIVRHLYAFTIKDMNRAKESFYKVEFCINQKKISTCAFLDTGNFLYEPISHLPVCVLEEKTFLRYFNHPLQEMIEKHEIKDIRMIPFQSVGNKNGIMPGILIHDMRITKEDRIIGNMHAVIALSDILFSKRGDYEMLLHPDLLKNGR